MDYLFDSHAHYYDARFDTDRDELIGSLKDNGVGWVINAGCDEKSTAASLALAEKYDFFYAACGFYPRNVGKITDENAAMEWLERCLEHPRAVAIGEIGLDYHYDVSFKELQKHMFERQLQLAEKLDVPVVIHDREAHQDIMDIIRHYPKVRGVFHCFSGSVEMAKELLERGWYISVSGVVTFTNAARLPEVAAFVPDDRLLIETDAPYLTPVPHRNERNCSIFMRHTAEKVAELRGVDYSYICEITANNASRLFGIRL